MPKYIYAVSPGTIGALSAIQSLLGVNAIHNPGQWMEPVYIIATPEQKDLVVELLDEAAAAYKLQYRFKTTCIREYKE